MGRTRNLCADFESELLLYLDGELAAERRTACAKHLVSCRVCQAELDETRRALDLYQTLPAPEIAGTRFADMLAGALSAGDADQSPSTPLVSLQRRWVGRVRLGRNAPLVSLAASLVLVLAGLLAGLLLGRRETPGITVLVTELRETQTRLTLALLEHRSAADRLYGLEQSHFSNPTDERLISALLTVLDQDPSANVRLAAIDALYRMPDVSPFRDELVRSLERQPSPVIKLALIDLMVDLRIESSAKLLRRIASEDRNKTIARRARWALQQLL